MAIKKADMPEVLNTILYHVNKATVRAVFRGLARTEAYRSNASFRITVDRAIEALADEQ